MLGRWICYVLAASVSLFVVALFIVEGLYRSQVRPKLLSDLVVQEKYYSPYLADQLFLHHSGFFQTKLIGQNDAGLVLNAKLFWAPTPASLTQRNKPLVPVDVRQSLLRFRSDWMKKFDRARNMRGDLSIFNGLARFDYWDIESVGPIADLIQRHEFVPPTHLPIPDVSDLLAASKLRLMWGAINKDPLPALSDIRQFAQLLMTTENSQLVLAGLVMLEYESFAYRFYIDELNLDPHSWVPVDQNLTRRAHRAILGTRNFLHLWTPVDHLEKIFLSEQPPIGICGAINDALPLELSLRPRLEPKWPFEESYRAGYRELDRVVERARASCRLRYLSDVISNHSIREPVPGPFILNRLPYSRKVFAMRISADNFTGFTSYESTSP